MYQLNNMNIALDFQRANVQFNIEKFLRNLPSPLYYKPSFLICPSPLGA